jgi:nucleoside-diphosphate-sugar epimerase
MASLPFELKGKAVYVAGHRGMVGSALVRRLATENVDQPLVRAAIRIPSEHAVGASSTYHSVISVRSFTSLSDGID